MTSPQFFAAAEPTLDRILCTYTECHPIIINISQYSLYEYESHRICNKDDIVKNVIQIVELFKALKNIHLFDVDKTCLE